MEEQFIVDSSSLSQPQKYEGWISSLVNVFLMIQELVKNG